MFKRVCRSYWRFNLRVFYGIRDFTGMHMWVVPLAVGGFIFLMLGTADLDGGCR
jgi:hypothetical protein